jgi:hypothetical protein
MCKEGEGGLKINHLTMLMKKPGLFAKSVLSRGLVSLYASKCFYPGSADCIL